MQANAQELQAHIAGLEQRLAEATEQATAASSQHTERVGHELLQLNANVHIPSWAVLC